MNKVKFWNLDNQIRFRWEDNWMIGEKKYLEIDLVCAYYNSIATIIIIKKKAKLLKCKQGKKQKKEEEKRIWLLQIPF